MSFTVIRCHKLIRQKGDSIQTFLPYADFTLSVQCLDRLRLGKQRVEARQIHSALVSEYNGWRYHPAVRMWVGYQSALAVYYNMCLLEWTIRGYKNNMAPIIHDSNPPMPYWFGQRDFHISHQSNLVRKDSHHYRRYFPNVRNDIPYYWPGR